MPHGPFPGPGGSRWRGALCPDACGQSDTALSSGLVRASTARGAQQEVRDVGESQTHVWGDPTSSCLPSPCSCSRTWLPRSSFGRVVTSPGLRSLRFRPRAHPFSGLCYKSFNVLNDVFACVVLWSNLSFSGCRINGLLFCKECLRTSLGRTFQECPARTLPHSGSRQTH